LYDVRGVRMPKTGIAKSVPVFENPTLTRRVGKKKSSQIGMPCAVLIGPKLVFGRESDSPFLDSAAEKVVAKRRLPTNNKRSGPGCLSDGLPEENSDMWGRRQYLTRILAQTA
jgi:hypothetical protein